MRSEGELQITERRENQWRTHLPLASLILYNLSITAVILIYVLYNNGTIGTNNCKDLSIEMEQTKHEMRLMHNKMSTIVKNLRELETVNQNLQQMMAEGMDNE